MAPPRDTSVRYPGGRRALWGAVGFVLTYAVMVPVALWKGTSIFEGVTVAPGPIDSTPITEFAAVEQFADWKIAGMLTYNAHFTPIDFPIEVSEGDVIVEPINLVTTSGGPFVLLLFLVPILVYAGTAAWATRDVTMTSPTERGFKGALQFAGVFPLAVLGLFVFSFSTAGTMGGPSLLWGLVLAGFVYPAVCGFLGAFLAETMSEDTKTSSTRIDRWNG